MVVKQSCNMPGEDVVSVKMQMNLEEYREFICGWGAALINITATFPINKAMFRQQLHGISGFKAVTQLQKEGLGNLYRGVVPPLMQKTTSLSLMFGMYHKFQHMLMDQCPTWSKTSVQATAAMLAGMTEATLSPFERVQTLMQDRTYHKRFTNTPHAMYELRTYGLREYYRGLTPILMRNGPSNVMFFLGRDFLHDLVPLGESPTERFLKHFISGAVLGAFISTFFYPLNVVKTRMQSKLGGEYLGVWRTFLVVLEERGYSVRKLFRGYHLNYTRSFLSWGIINASYEYLMKHLFRKSELS
ncbi:mitochondrial nicotinamide adenine dinucleotide transporter SLC25A51-like [Haliotis rufescens]|uniref:mitochondrial nicotinamide adenine dinucleotide transporter SLC25A51-like n=1 Tax=Haliotis rufescens TaxID=6454 RepID=UPI001EB06E9B|nr:mitochondrial nicotinamide adenine dinucleotide transporter SLC25A51-like [Haliotis rufescens]